MQQIRVRVISPAYEYIRVRVGLWLVTGLAGTTCIIQIYCKLQMSISQVFHN